MFAVGGVAAPVDQRQNYSSIWASWPSNTITETRKSALRLLTAHFINVPCLRQGNLPDGYTKLPRQASLRDMIFDL